MSAHYEGAGFRERFGPWAVIAGGSDGIGAAFARELAKRGLHVALIARDEGKLETTAAQIRAEAGVETRTLSVDLTSPELVSAVADATDALDVGLFIYNAGSNRKTGKFLDLSPDDSLFLVQLSCRGPLLLAHHFGSRLRARGRGGLILMSSMASIAGSSYQVTYSATKAFDTIFAEGLWHELAPEGIDVLGVIAGATKTETTLAASDAFDDAMPPEQVAVGALDHLGKGPSYVPGEANQAAARGMWPVPRIALINGMSQAGAALFGLTTPQVPGVEFYED